jgi:hypothetical protein
MTRKRIVRWATGVIIVTIVLGMARSDHAAAQTVPSATPAQISIPTATVPVTQDALPTPTWTATPTAAGVVLLEALNEANVRAEPDVNSEQLGTIRAGETYAVIGRSFRWLQFRYENAIGGTGWVYDELVTVIGNADDIPDLNANLLPTADTSALNATQTWEAINQTPGGVLTTTAEARIIQAPNATPHDVGAGDVVAGNNDTDTGAVLPTFTYPPGVVAQAPTPGAAVEQTRTPTSNGLSGTTSGGVAPIVPILILGGFGILGLTISSRRAR